MGQGGMRAWRRAAAAGLMLGAMWLGPAPAWAQALPHPVLFVTQVPLAADFANAVSTFGSHHGRIDRAPRGGDLMIRYPDGSLRNLTAEAGFGNAGMQLGNAIAVRDPAVHWSGQKAVFSMVVGAPTVQYQQATFYWQLYEVSGLGQGETVAIAKVPNQPADYNNVHPTYASDGSLIFASDRPRSGERHLYPQQDEYESDPTVTGLWRLDPASGELRLLQHSPSGSFHPIVDSVGRILYTRWDHLQADQQAEADTNSENAGQGTVFGTFDFASEAADAARGPRAPEIFPEPQFLDPNPLPNVNPHRFNFFFPWELNQDGTAEETLNHLGRHELQAFFTRSFTDDPELEDFNGVGRVNPNAIENTFYLAEDPTRPGRYYAIDAPEFGVHGSGQLLRFDAQPGLNPDQVVVEYLTARSTFGTGGGAFASGRYRNPLPLSDGRIVAVHTPDTGEDEEQGDRASPDPRYAFRLKLLQAGAGGFLEPGPEPASLITGSGIQKSLQWWDPDVLVSWSGTLWELSPVEVRPRPVPPVTGFSLPTPEAAAFGSVGVGLSGFRSQLAQRGLGLIVVRDATARDRADEQQPYNLRVPGGVQTDGGSGQVYEISHMQFFQANQVRGIGGMATPTPGRRPLAQAMNDAAALEANAALLDGPPGSVPILPDGSLAVFVPARRALSWQSLSPAGDPVVRERFWITLQPGEIRVCDGCHGVNTRNQADQPPVEHTAQALMALLQQWQQGNDTLFGSGFEADPLSR
jgi:hypothetical protein